MIAAPCADHAPRLRDRARRRRETAAIGKAVRRDVEDAHHHGLGAELEAAAMGQLPCRGVHHVV